MDVRSYIITWKCRTSCWSSISLVVEGVVGNGFEGDISVDDLAINQGPCPASSKF